jgi:serine/threonine protein kinase
MSKPSRSQPSPAIPIELVAELDELCVEREQARGTNQGLGGGFREQRIQELQTALLEFPQPTPGAILAGARLERVLAAGSFSTVWRATRGDSGAECAVEVLHASCAARARMLRHFRQGIGALRALTAAGAPASIVRFLGADESQLAFSMTLVAGSDLKDIARRAWSLEKKMQVFSGMCAAVKFAHDRGILHRDLHPGNVLYDEAAQGPVLTNFDLADVSELAASPSSSRWWYAAPEIQRGEQERLRESDVYSLGRLLQYLITEQTPEAGAELRIGDQTIVRIIATCTRQEPGQRYGDVEEIQTEIRRWRSGLSVSAARQSVHPPTAVPPQKLLVLSPGDVELAAPQGKLLLWLAVLGLLGTGAGFAWTHRSELGWASSAPRPVAVPDAGPAPAPKKKKPRPRRRTPSESSGSSVSLDGAISRLFDENSAAFARCHSGGEQAAEDLRGRVVTRFKVDAQGVLSEARLIESNIKAAGVARCLVAAHNGLRLDTKPGQPTSGQSRYEIE